MGDEGKKRIKVIHDGFKTEFICNGFKVNYLGDLEIIDNHFIIAVFSRGYWDNVIELKVD